MQRKQTWFLAGCFVLGPIAGGLWAEDAAKSDQTPTRQLESVKDQQAVSAKLLRAKSLIGKSVNNEEGKDIGTIQDIVVDTRHGRIAYAVLQFGGFLGFGEKQFAIPFHALQEDAAQQNLILNVKKEKLEAARGFDKDKWPDMANEEWARDTHKHYGYDNYWDSHKNNAVEPKRDTGTAEPKTDLKPDNSAKLPSANGSDVNRSEITPRPQLDRENIWVNRVTEMLGKPVKNIAGEDLGKVADFMVDMKHGRLVYAILTDGGTLGISENLTAVPVSALKAEPVKKQFTLNASAEELKAFTFKESAWPNMSDMHWARKIHTGFKQEPYWNVHGYAAEDVDAGWRHDSDYNKMFSAQKSQTIKGKVTSISEFTPAKDSAKGRAIVVTNDAGDVYTVHLGPVSFLDRKDAPMKLSVGDTITVVGSTGTFEGKQVLQAREITGTDGKACQFRDEQGRPMWDRETDRHKTPKSDVNRPDATTKTPINRP